MTFLRDEQGSRSSARLLLWITVAAALLLIAVDVLTAGEASPHAYTLLGGMVTTFAVWAAGPRMAQYLAPLAGKVVESLARTSREPDARRDDERGDYYDRAER